MSTRLTVGRWAAGFIACLFAALSISWILDPGWTAHLFGPIRLEGAQLAYGRVKGFEDLLVAAVLFVALRSGQMRVLGAALGLVLLAPIGDVVALASSGVRDPSSLLTHIGFISWMGTTAILVWSAPSSVAEQTAAVGERAGVRVATLRAGSLRTRVLETGPAGAAEAVVFLHGSPGSANDWDALLQLTGAFARSVAFDLPGFGEADKPGDWAYSPQSFAAFVADALRALGITRAHLVMSNLGGVGLLWAAGEPDAFVSAVMIDTGVLADFRWHWIARLHRTPVVGWLMALTARPGLPSVMRFFGRGTPHQLPREVVRGWRDRYDWPTRRAMLRFYRATPPGCCPHTTTTSTPFRPVADALRALDRPALVVWGAHDRFLPLAHADRQLEAFPSAQVRVLDDSGHYPHLDDPDGVAAVVVPFLRAHVKHREAVVITAQSKPAQRHNADGAVT
jgi:pimeloyl-ACP methyl ester carboxylesterase